ncbi:MAG: thioredoxin [Pseudomonadota bacterium]
MSLAAVTDDNFQNLVIDSDLPVVVDFWAEWCNPCKMIAPILEESAAELKGKIHIYKMNVDDSKLVPAKYGIRGIPTLILFDKEAEVARMVGALSKSEFLDFINQNLVDANI